MKKSSAAVCMMRLMRRSILFLALPVCAVLRHLEDRSTQALGQLRPQRGPITAYGKELLHNSCQALGRALTSRLTFS